MNGTRDLKSLQQACLSFNVAQAASAKFGLHVGNHELQYTE
jgi:hypothetical protein